MAHGGEAGSFCSEDRKHNKDCEYYLAGGGTAGDAPDFIPFDAPSPSTGSDTPDFIPFEPAATQATPDFISNEDWDKPAAPSLSNEAPDKYGTVDQEFGATLEGGLRGIAGPLATAAETGAHKIGIDSMFGVDTSAEAQAGRKKASPVLSGTAEAATLVGSSLFGIGEMGLLAKVGGAAAEAAGLGKIGSMAIKGFIEGAGISGGDEITKALLGQGDPEYPVGAALMNVGAVGVLGGLSGGAFGLGEKLMGKVIPEILMSKSKEEFDSLLQKAAKSKNILDVLGVTKLAEYKKSMIAGAIAAKTGVLAPVTYKLLRKGIDPLFEKVLGPAGEYTSAAVLKALAANETDGIYAASQYVRNVGKGVKTTADGMNSLFKAGASQIVPPVTKEVRDGIKDFVKGGGTNTQIENTMHAQPQTYAKGGMVSAPNTSFSRIFPEQDAMLNASRGRIYNYLNSVRPATNTPRLAFDKPTPQKSQERSYDRAVDLAASPASIFDTMNRGELTPEHVKHFAGMYPEVHSYLSKEMTKKITEAQMKDEMPPYNKRQAMSLFLGVRLDSTFTPQAIQTLQMQYAPKQPAPAPGGGGSKKALTKGPSAYLTGEQARTQRDQNQKA